jgi:hypothetical protein
MNTFLFIRRYGCSENGINAIEKKKNLLLFGLFQIAPSTLFKSIY